MDRDARSVHERQDRLEGLDHVSEPTEAGCDSEVRGLAVRKAVTSQRELKSHRVNSCTARSGRPGAMHPVSRCWVAVGEGARPATGSEGKARLAIDVQQGLNETWYRVATFVPKFVGFVVIVFLGDVLAMVLARKVDRVLERIGFDGWDQRGLLGRTLESAGVDAFDVLWIVTVWGVVL